MSNRTKKLVILFPSDYFSCNKVDEDWKEEYNIAKEHGFPVALFDSSLWFNKKKFKLNMKDFEEKYFILYRGWMMKPEMYECFYKALLKQNCHLYVTPKEYENMHDFTKTYPLICEDTAKMLMFPLHSKVDIQLIRKHFKKFMIKDYVKSVKDSRFPAWFDSNMSQEKLDEWLDMFYQFRKDSLTGGICIKEYLNLKRYGDKTNEWRVFYFNHQILCMYQNSGIYTKCKQPSDEMLHKYDNLNSHFYTIDYAEMEDGSWKIIECGDGQVSGLLNKDVMNEFYERIKGLADYSYK